MTVAAIPDWLLDAPLYRNRFDGGRQLVHLLPEELDSRTVVVGLARGGVEVASEVAAARRAPLDVVAVRKVRHPYQPEYALGAVTPGDDGTYLRSHDGMTDTEIADAIEDARREAEELDGRLHEQHRPLDTAGKTVLLVDDGLATGATMIAAARWARCAGATHVAAAVPIAARQSVEDVLRELDLFYCPHVRPNLVAVGLWYADFEPVSDADVLALLDAANARVRAAASLGKTPRVGEFP